jgi:hypothetical protein
LARWASCFLTTASSHSSPSSAHTSEPRGCTPDVPDVSVHMGTLPHSARLLPLPACACADADVEMQLLHQMECRMLVMLMHVHAAVALSAAASDSSAPPVVVAPVLLAGRIAMQHAPCCLLASSLRCS